jgi:regulator of protease activity HflC (stomatin/prohibitin superfamily)
MKRMMTIFAAIGIMLMLSACNEQVPAGYVGKIMGKNGWQPEVYPPSKVWLANNIWNINYEKMFLVQTTTQKFVQPIKVLLKDKLTLHAEIVFRGRITQNKKVLNALFNDMPMNDNIVHTAEVYNVYGKMIVLNTARDVISKYTVDDVNKNYERITVELYQALLPKLKGLPIDISDVTIGDIQYPKIVTEAIEKAKQRQMLIQQERAQVQIDVTKAKGREQVAMAEYKVKMLQAKQIRDFNKMIASGLTPDLIELKKIEKWNGVLPTTVVGKDTALMISK